MSHPAVTASIIGARNLTQLEGSLAAVDVKMTPEWREEISALSIHHRLQRIGLKSISRISNSHHRG